MPAPPRHTAALLETPGGINHGFYGRLGGVSTGLFTSLNCSHFAGDQNTAVDANRQRVADHLGATHIFTNRQVHGNRVRVITADADPNAPFAADGLVTAAPRLALGVLAADCAPVLFADPVARVIGAAHAGWKGALCGVTDAVLEKMAALGARPERTLCAIGPAIQAPSYRVGAEFFARLRAESPVRCEDCFHTEHNADNTNDGYYFDLPRYVQKRLARAGIVAVETLPDDTCRNEARFFSYRRSCQRKEASYGRQIGAIVLA